MQGCWLLKQPLHPVATQLYKIKNNRDERTSPCSCALWTAVTSHTRYLAWWKFFKTLCLGRGIFLISWSSDIIPRIDCHTQGSLCWNRLQPRHQSGLVVAGRHCTLISRPEPVVVDSNQYCIHKYCILCADSGDLKTLFCAFFKLNTYDSGSIFEVFQSHGINSTI
jgi:hypothetical protein